jgi:hypothetical protein
MQNLNKKLYNIDRKYSKSPKRGKNPLIRLVIFILVLVLAVFVPSKMAFEGFKGAQLHSKAIASAYQTQNFGQIQDQVKETEKSLSTADFALNFLFWMRFLPVIGGYYSDIKGISSASVEDLKAIETILADLKPKEKELGFLGKPVGGQERISQAVAVLDASLPSLNKVQGNLKKAADSVSSIDTNKYPEEFRGVKLRQTVLTAKNFITGAYVAVSQDQDLLATIPQALGSDKPKNYLILFQNDKEIRATGGFMTAYAFLKIDKGQINSTTSDDIYRLDEKLLTVCQNKICPLTPPAPIAKYLPEANGKPRSAWSMRDSNLSPDLPTSAKQFEKMYALLGEGTPFDGIIYIDSQVVEALIEVTGPIDVFGTNYSAEVDKRCNCPNVIYELESYAEIAAKGEKDRKAVLGVLMQQILSKIVGADTDKMPFFIETVATLANHKHIMFYMHDDKTQAAMSNLNWIGQIKSFDGDYIHINDSNFAGGKSNLYVEQTVTQEISKDGDQIKKKLTIEYKNPQPFGIWLNGINRDYVRVYVPKGSKLNSSKGSDNPVTTIEDLDKTVFEAFVQVRPQNSRKLELEFTVPYKPNGDYKLLVQKQPGAKDFHYIIKANGVTKDDFKLDMDKEFKFGI